MWRGVVAAKYGEDQFGWFSGRPTDLMGCGVWQGIFKGMGTFVPLISFRVNNGEEVRFWQWPLVCH